LDGGPDGLGIQSFFVHRRLFAGPAFHRWQYLRPGRLQINAQVGDGCLIVTQPGESFSDSDC
jgi:hypothetical protein